MGSSVSIDRGSESATKPRFSIRSKSRKSSSSLNGQNPIAQFGSRPYGSSFHVSAMWLYNKAATSSHWHWILGSKDETFFDSRAWLDSDCDEDFVSVNGDFTPSRGSISNHRNSFTESPRHSKSRDTDRPSNLKPGESSPTEKKKRLYDLLQDSFDDIYNFSNEAKVGSGNGEVKPLNLDDHPPKSAVETPYLSKSNSIRSGGEKTPNRYSKPPKPKSANATKCCMPSLVTSLSFHERKKKDSPGRTFIE
ncbi:hypothetical protein Scep_018155 [Stephania cephalantha]|uniref:Uncharacterized protein n=1 Tax=Stephania cephalantha TaxID=152367 RepID=A0AAP0IST1_9MAGN